MTAHSPCIQPVGHCATYCLSTTTSTLLGTACLCVAGLFHFGSAMFSMCLEFSSFLRLNTIPSYYGTHFIYPWAHRWIPGRCKSCCEHGRTATSSRPCFQSAWKGSCGIMCSSCCQYLRNHQAVPTGAFFTPTKCLGF